MVLVLLLLTLNMQHTIFSVSIVNYEQVNVSWIMILTAWSETIKNIIAIRSIRLNLVKFIATQLFRLKTKIGVLFAVKIILTDIRYFSIRYK